MVSYNAILILSALTQGANYGLEVMDITGLSSGTVYPALRRLEAQALVRGAWEETPDAHAEGRPARRYYGITETGAQALREGMERLRAQQRILGWAGELNG